MAETKKIKAVCPDCGARMGAKPEHFQSPITCPKCKNDVMLRKDTTESAEAESADQKKKARKATEETPDRRPEEDSRRTPSSLKWVAISTICIAVLGVVGSTAYYYGKNTDSVDKGTDDVGKDSYHEVDATQPSKKEQMEALAKESLEKLMKAWKINEQMQIEHYLGPLPFPLGTIKSLSNGKTVKLWRTPHSIVDHELIGIKHVNAYRKDYRTKAYKNRYFHTAMLYVLCSYETKGGSLQKRKETISFSKCLDGKYSNPADYELTPLSEQDLSNLKCTPYEE